MKTERIREFINKTNALIHHAELNWHPYLIAALWVFLLIVGGSLGGFSLLGIFILISRLPDWAMVIFLMVAMMGFMTYSIGNVIKESQRQKREANEQGRDLPHENL